tara:strand:- start:343 stop:663 length:321 start_codon:yes stop_codon:yes gene_type:complete
MDNRLDFSNTTREYLKTLTEDDTLLVMGYNKKEGDLFFTLFGDWEDISLIMSDKDFVNHQEDSKDDLNQIRKLILNTTLNICHKDSIVLNTLLKGLNQIKKTQDEV